MSRRQPSSSKTPWIVGLLVLGLACLTLLAVNAVYSARSHRAAAEAVLRDYAALAADELSRRIAAEIGYYGHLEALRALRDPQSDFSTPSSELATKDPRAQRALELIRWAFQLDRTSQSVRPIGPVDYEPSTALRSALVAAAGSEPETEGDYSLLLWEGSTFVIERVSNAPKGSAVGFEIEESKLSSWARRALDRQPLLPPSLGGGQLTNDMLFLRVTHGAGTEILRLGEPQASALHVERRLAPDYLQPLVDLRVEVAITPAAATALVIGGVPASRMPVLAGLLLLTAALLATAVILMRREREVTRMRTDFVARVSHELRTPLTQIRLFVDTLRLDRARNDEEQRRALEVIDRETVRLTHLVENVLQLSRAQHPRTLTPTSIDLASLLEATASEVGPALRRHSGADDARIVVDSEPIQLVADEAALRQSLVNLLDNAAKYGPPGQMIQIGAQTRGDTVLLWVDDEGPGIPAALRDQLWKPFARAGAPCSSSGTGIGLSVVRELTELHGGRCHIETSPRGGTRVVLELPQTVTSHATISGEGS